MRPPFKRSTSNPQEFLMPKNNFNFLTGLLLSVILIICAVPLSFAQKTVHVKTYTRKDGTVVHAHDRSAPGTKSTSQPSSTTRTSESARTTSTTPVFTTTTITPATRPRTVSITIERDSHGRIKRSGSAKHAFMQMHPCPLTGSTNGKCSGYVIDHITALKCGGLDDTSNMQWQTKEAAKAKDKWERAGCR
jgi:hypothetical protein